MSGRIGQYHFKNFQEKSLGANIIAIVLSFFASYHSRELYREDNCTRGPCGGFSNGGPWFACDFGICCSGKDKRMTFLRVRGVKSSKKQYRILRYALLVLLVTICWSFFSNGGYGQSIKLVSSSKKTTSATEVKEQPANVSPTQSAGESQINQKEKGEPKLLIRDKNNPLPECMKAAYTDGLYQEVYDYLKEWTLNPSVDPVEGAKAVELVCNCMDNLNRVSERDEWFEKLLQVHNDKPLILCALAVQNSNNSYGVIIDNRFVRGERNGQVVNSNQRDRVWSLRRMVRGMTLLEDESVRKKYSEHELLRFYETFIGFFSDAASWKLQILTDLDQLPDYEEGYERYANSVAPVDSSGNPIFYVAPASFAKAKSDGERFMWILEQLAKISPKGQIDSLGLRGQFAQRMFGVQTLNEYGLPFRRNVRSSEDQASILSLETLTDDETIARLANGVKRFKLPAGYNYIALMKELYERQQSSYDKYTVGRGLAQEYLNRRQFSKAAAQFKAMFSLDIPADEKSSMRKDYDDIVGNWGCFDPLRSKAAGTDVNLFWTFRNGHSVKFTATRIDIPLLIDDIKSYLKNYDNKEAGKIDHNKMQIENIGYQILLEKGNTQKYLKETIASWEVKLDPPKDHFDAQMAIPLPFNKAGAWLVQAVMTNGNSDAIVVWINDTAIVEKSLDNALLYYATDAKTGKPLPDITLDFFMFGLEHLPNTSSRRSSGKTIGRVRQFTAKTNQEGQYIFGDPESTRSHNMQWLIRTEAGNDDESQRFAWLGFKPIWFRTAGTNRLSRDKAFVIFDRPVYRTGQKVEYKIWVGKTQYDLPEGNQWENKKLWLSIRDPRGTVTEEREITLDNKSGYAGSFELAKDATLGTYQVFVSLGKNRRGLGNGLFHAEEYRKPEYEVLIDSPKEPVALGETFSAKISAKYYFGAPVTHAKVKYTVTRTRHESFWCPVRPWDWFYGNGYWWFGSDYAWYPGWRNWGYSGPRWPWFPRLERDTTEVVQTATIPIGPDGTVDVKIDSETARNLYPDDDQQYTISAEVTDSSRRVITSSSSVFVPCKPFKVYTWLRGGFFEPGQQIAAFVQTRRLDGKAVPGKVEYALYRITYQPKKDGNGVEPSEKQVWTSSGKIGEDGIAQVELLAGDPGQYRFSAKVVDSNQRCTEGAYLFTIHGQGSMSERDFEFNELELIPDREEYRPGDTVRLLIGSKRADATVLLFARSVNGVCSRPQLITLDGKCRVVQIKVEQADMPNFFIEALTVSNGNVYTAMRQIVVPPEKRILNVEVLPSGQTYTPGQKAKALIRITDQEGKPVSGQAVVSIYDKSIEYIRHSSIPNICEYFWKWQRSSSVVSTHNLSLLSQPIRDPEKRGFTKLGIYGEYLSGVIGMENAASMSIMESLGGARKEDANRRSDLSYSRARLDFDGEVFAAAAPMPAAAPMHKSAKNNMAKGEVTLADSGMLNEVAQETTVFAAPAIRRHFADTAFWTANLEIAKDGTGNIELSMPENLTTWKINAWVMASGTRVGQGTTEVITKKNLMIRMQKPRFLIQGDTVVLSANVHNYLSEGKKVRVSLEFPIDTQTDTRKASSLRSLQKTMVHDVVVPAGGEKRVDWNVKAETVAHASILMKALTDVESDAMQDTLPIHVHGMVKQDAVSVVIPSRHAPANSMVSAAIEMKVPEQCRPDETKLTIRFSPTLAGAILESLPYLASYPYGCTEQTLNRFLPTVIVRKTLQDSGLKLEDFAASHSNLNPQELGDASVRARQWKKSSPNHDNPVFDEHEVARMTREGLEKLTQMQCSDGGWGWFSGYGERSDAYLTGLVVRGLFLAKQANVEVDSEVLNKGLQWLVLYQQRQSEKIMNARQWSDQKKKDNPQLWKTQADNVDAFVWSVLVESQAENILSANSSARKTRANSGTNDVFSYFDFMQEEIWKVRGELSLLVLARYGVALTTRQDSVSNKRVDHCIRMLSQYLKQDDENQTAWLDLGRQHRWCWWSWFGSPFETQAEYLKLLVRRRPNDNITPRIVKYLLNNRKNATYWNSTRDTACCLEAFCEYLKQTAELKPKTTIQIRLDGKTIHKVDVDSKNLFSFDNTVIVAGAELRSGTHRIEITNTGNNPLYCNAYLEYFTTEDRIGETGLEVKIQRRYYLLQEDQEARKNVAGGHGQVVSARVEKYKRLPLADLTQVQSGKLIEVELIIESKNDYESLLIEDMKAAGFEPVDLRSGYTGNELGAYVEFRDERVCFFVHRLSQGKHSVSYRLRAEQPGQFSALPARITGMYAPELKANSDEFKTIVMDAPSGQ